jgi:phage protein U
MIRRQEVCDVAIIGSLGDIVFEVSNQKVRTFNDFSRSASARWADHEIIGRKPLSEFIGPDLDEIKFRMRFDVALGLNPRNELDRLLIKCRTGKPETLVIGGKPLGMFKWTVRQVGQSWKTFDGAGRLLVAEVDVTLKEYMAR